MSKHTPGPWTLKEDRHQINVVGADGFDIAAFNIEGDYTSPALERANARLTAAAPDLLAALVQAVDQLEADYEESPLDGHGALIRKLRAAIRKAGGGRKHHNGGWSSGPGGKGDATDPKHQA